MQPVDKYQSKTKMTAKKQMANTLGPNEGLTVRVTLIQIY